MDQTSQKYREALTSIGLKLKEVREKNGLTIQDVSSSTRINQGFLNKIEAGDSEGLPAPPFVRGFINNYTKFLELDNDTFEEEFRRMAEQDKGERDTQLDLPPELTEEYNPKTPFGKIGIIVAGVILVAWIVYLFLPGPGPDPQNDTVEQASVEQYDPQDPTDPDAPQANIDGATNPDGEPTGTDNVGGGPQNGENLNALPPTRKKSLRLSVRGLEPTWLRLSVDQGNPIEVYLESAETLEKEADEEFRLTVGRSNGVSVYLNGEEIILGSTPNMLIPEIVLNKHLLLKLEN